MAPSAARRMPTKPIETLTTRTLEHEIPKEGPIVISTMFTTQESVGKVVRDFPKEGMFFVVCVVVVILTVAIV